MDLIIIYGSETGNAQDLAEQMVCSVYILFPHSVRCTLVDADTFISANDLMSTSHLIVVCSTTGQGDPPHNMRQRFWPTLMRRGLPPNSLAHMHFAVLGLGDSSYARYNFVAKKVFRRMEQLGGKSMLELGLLDDQHARGWQGVLETWLPSLWNRIYNLSHSESVQLSLDKPATTLCYDASFTKFRVRILESNTSTDAPQCIYPSTAEQLLVIGNERVTSAEHFQETRLIRFRCPKHLAYKPGDVLHVQPQNIPHEVNIFLTILHEHDCRLHGETMITLEDCDPNFPVPTDLKDRPLQLQWLLTNYFDLHCVPRFSFFTKLAAISQHEDEKEKLTEWTSGSEDGLDDLYRYCFLPRRTLTEVLIDFPHTARCVILPQWFDLLTPLRSRPFSIASSPLYHPGEMHILVARVEYPSVTIKSSRIGVCSNYLAQLQPGSSATCFVGEGSLSFPDPSVPVILIGPGTGVAPLRSVLLQRLASRTYKDDAKDLLFFGCRYASRDYYFSDDLSRLSESGVKVITAFSREESINSGGSLRKVYVQDRLCEWGSAVWQTLNSHPKSCFIVTGNAKSMPQAVRDALLQIISLYGNLDKGEAERYVATLELKGRYQTETWS